jgi:hypothetical protein
MELQRRVGILSKRWAWAIAHYRNHSPVDAPHINITWAAYQHRRSSSQGRLFQPFAFFPIARSNSRLGQRRIRGAPAEDPFKRYQ